MKVNNLEPKHDYYIDDKGNKFVLDRYGFHPMVNYNYKLESRKVQYELEEVSADLLRYKKEREDLYHTINKSPLRQTLQTLKKIINDGCIDTEEKLKQIKKRLSIKALKDE